ncbi:hypothetical protein ACFDTS_004711, partial [Salmonella enterica]
AQYREPQPLAGEAPQRTHPRFSHRFLARFLFRTVLHRGFIKINTLKIQPQKTFFDKYTTLVVDINTTLVLYLPHQQDAGSKTERQRSLTSMMR